MTSAPALVTGANGFVGRALCAALRRDGTRVRALLRPASGADGPWDETARCELGREPVPRGALLGIDRVYHLAGIAHASGRDAPPPERYRAVNVRGTRDLLRAMGDAGVRRIAYASSIKAVADPGERCVDEGHDDWPDDPYGRSKREAEAEVLAWGAEAQRHASVIRPSLVYGVGVKGNLDALLRAVAAGRCPPLPETGNRRSLVALDDLVAALRLAVGTPAAAGRVYIACDGEHYSTRRIIDAFRSAANLGPQRRTIPRWALFLGARSGDAIGAVLHRQMPLDTEVYRRLTASACFRADRLRGELGWQPRCRLEDMAPQMLSAINTDGIA